MNLKLALCALAAGSSNRADEPSFLRQRYWQGKVLDAAKVCGGADKVLKVETQQTFVNGLLEAVTFGIYTPRFTAKPKS